MFQIQTEIIYLKIQKMTCLQTIYCVFLAGSPVGRAYHKSVYHNNRVFVMGGGLTDTMV